MMTEGYASRHRERLLPLYPLLFALYPVLALYNANITRLTLAEVVRPAAIVIAAAALLQLGFTILWRRPHQAAAATFLIILPVFSYEYVRQFISTTFHYALRHQQMLLLFAGLLGFAFGALLLSGRELRKLSVALSVSALCLNAMAMLGIINYEFRHPAPQPASPTNETAPAVMPAAPATASASAADLYVIVLDRYAGEAALRGIFAIDNDTFHVGLRQRGFSRAPQAMANYPKTFLSLASMLNLEYLDSLRTPPATMSTDRLPAFNLIREHALQRMLAARGYRYYHIGSRWPQTASNPHAYRNLHPDLPDLLSFSWRLFSSTLFAPLMERWFDYSADGIARKRIRYAFDALTEIAPVPSPKLVFAHILLPHPPYIFRADGTPRNRREQHALPSIDAYRDHVACANRFVLAAIDSIIARSAKPPVILLLADEGPFIHPEFGGDDQQDGAGINWLMLSDTALVSHMSVLTAIRFPQPQPPLPPFITPVNAMRRAVSAATGDTLAPLPDIVYTFPDMNHLYGFIDVTNRVRRWPVNSPPHL